MSIAVEAPRGSGDPRARSTSMLFGSFDLDPALARAWIDALILEPPPGLSAQELVALLCWRSDLTVASPVLDMCPAPVLLPPRCRILLQMACQEATLRSPSWAEPPLPSITPAPPPRTKTPLEKGLDQLPDEIWDAVFGPTNVAGTVAQSASLLDALHQSLPLTWRVALQGGTWELYDANGHSRNHAFGKQAKLRFPRRMTLRARGVRMGWLVRGGRMSGGALRIPAPGAKTVQQALRIARANTMKLIPRTA